MKNERSKFKNDKWYAQSRFLLFWFIPTPLWRTYMVEYGDIVMGTCYEESCFNTKEQCDIWIEENKNDY